ncbi:MAG: hypothetical protein JWM64_2748 [Frankiales bacterium]|nr:hypothetical protein [Frankiales bacterium]
MTAHPDDDDAPERAGGWRPQGAERPRPPRTRGRRRKPGPWAVVPWSLHTWATDRGVVGAWGLAALLAVPAVASALLGDLVPALLFAVAAACLASTGRDWRRQRLHRDARLGARGTATAVLAVVVVALGAAAGAL